MDTERRTFEISCERFPGLTPAHYLGRFFSDGDEYELIGILAEHPRCPLRGRRLRDGRTFRFIASVATRIELSEKMRKSLDGFRLSGIIIT
jgi:hypothetical protein